MAARVALAPLTALRARNALIALIPLASLDALNALWALFSADSLDALLAALAAQALDALLAAQALDPLGTLFTRLSALALNPGLPLRPLNSGFADGALGPDQPGWITHPASALIDDPGLTNTDGARVNVLARHIIRLSGTMGEGNAVQCGTRQNLSAFNRYAKVEFIPCKEVAC